MAQYLDAERVSDRRDFDLEPIFDAPQLSLFGAIEAAQRPPARNGAFGAWLAHESTPRVVIEEDLRARWWTPAIEDLAAVGLDFLDPESPVWTPELQRQVLGATSDVATASAAVDAEGSVRGVFVREIARCPTRLIGLVIGRPWTSARFAALSRLAGLTQSEAKAVEGLLEGLDAGLIARNLDIGKETLRTHLKHAYSKIGVRSRGELFAHALRFETP